MAQQYVKDQPEGYNNRIERVAIIGAGGRVGRNMAEAIIAAGRHTLTAITRQGSSSELPAGINVAKVDYNDETSLVEALKGQQFLIISMHSRAKPDDYERLHKATAKAGVPWVMPNAYCPDIADEKFAKDYLVGQQVLDSIKTIENEGVSSWIAMCCSFWYEYSLSFGPNAYGFDIANRKVTFFDEGSTKIDTSTWQRCGEAVVALLSLPVLPEDADDKSVTLSNWRNKPLYVSSFTISQRDMLDNLHQAMGTTDADWSIEKESVTDRYSTAVSQLKDRGYPAFVTAMYSRIFFPDGEGNFSARRGNANQLLGLKDEDLNGATKRAVEMVKGV